MRQFGGVFLCRAAIFSHSSDPVYLVVRSNFHAEGLWSIKTFKVYGSSLRYISEFSCLIAFEKLLSF